MENNISIIKGNIFNSHAQTIVNTVNCVGVMGKGIALVYKLRYPHLFEKYQDICKKRLLDIGKLWLYKEDVTAPWVLNFPTKKHWKYPSEYEYIEAGLQKFLSSYKEKGIKSIAFPLLGASNGGLNAEIVLDMMKKYLSHCDIPVEIYIFDPASTDDLFDSFKAKWNSLSADKIKSITGIRMQKQIDIISTALNSGQIRSMISLIEFPGIGLSTMQKCFNMVMQSKTVTEPNLFEIENLAVDTTPSCAKESDDSEYELMSCNTIGVRIYHYVIDTNVFVNCPDIISKIDNQHKIVLSAKVADELDRLKVKLTDKDRKSVERALRNINRVRSREIFYELSDSTILPEDFDKRNPDNLILSVALKYRDKNPIILTSDNGLQVKSKILKIPTISLKEFLSQIKD